jgi:hypothetical protein
MESPRKTHWLPRAVAGAVLALTAASCGPKAVPGNPRPASSNQGERLWARIVENLDDAEARRVLSTENFAKIREGMTLPEVSKLLGLKVLAKKPVESGCWVTWQGGGRKISVYVFDGKVSRKEQEGLK